MPTVMEAVPLQLDTQGVYRVGQTRVTLDSVLRAFHQGDTVEDIVSRFPSLEMADAYQVIAYYLRNRAELDAYLDDCSAREARLLAEHPEWSPVGLKNRLLERRARL